MVRAAVTLALIAGMGLAVATGAWPVAVGFGLSGAVCLGPIGRRVNQASLKHRPDRATPGTGTVLTMATVSVLPGLIIGTVCVAVTPKYWWMGFPSGWFLGFGVSMVAIWATLIAKLRGSREGASPTT